MKIDWTPKEIVNELNKYIIGQDNAKKAVAIALRNRYRRSMLPLDLQEDIIPKNILMIGPTGVGKTEIARRISKMVNAPFIKVEATKFTEVGYVGRDVESIIRDLVETSIRMVKNERTASVMEKAKKLANERLVDILCPKPYKKPSANPLEAFFGGSGRDDDPNIHQQITEEYYHKRKEIEEKLINNLLEDTIVEINVEDNAPPMLEVFSNTGTEEMGINLQDIFGSILPKKTKKRRLPVKDARVILTSQEAQKIIDMDEVIATGIQNAEQMGIVFIDEIDKIAVKGQHGGPEVSREGVQRDILPIIEGSTVMTKYGPVKTDFILFIAAGAFHISKPTDLIPELQGRFPIRVELQSLDKDDFIKILTKPRNALLKQYANLLSTEGVEINFTDEAIEEISRIACEVNRSNENIGARRLHTVLEKLLEEISFNAPEIKGRIDITKEYVEDKLSEILKHKDLTGLIL